MTIHESLNLVTLIMCVVTLTMASLALLPQIKQGLTILRDSVLWAVLLGIVIAVGVIGWNRLVSAQQGQAGEDTTDEPSGDYESFPREPHATFISDRYPALQRPSDRDSFGGGFPSYDRPRNSSDGGVR